ncbi:MAG: hypothetical protein CW338_04490 [Clostridiales bacterium]|nr:hypothetical protein [Clostridiales bacterium]
MKTLVSVILVLTLVFSVCAFASAEGKQPSGGWMPAKDTALTEEAAAALEKALQGFTGATYEPVALIGTQIVAGLNYCLLCKGTLVTAQPVEFYALVYVYADLEGNASITRVDRLTAVPSQNAGLAGGWQDNAEAFSRGAAALEKALTGFAGAGYAPVAVIGTQVVAGTNYCLLCRGTLVTAQPAEFYALVYVYEDLQGNAAITQIRNLEPGMDLNEETAEADEDNAVLNIAGPYQDRISERAMMDIEPGAGNTACIVISWGNGAYETWIWTMSGVYDAENGLIPYEDGVLEIHSWDENDSETVTTVYGNGTGVFTVNEDWTITWQDDMENAGQDCVFEFCFDL